MDIAKEAPKKIIGAAFVEGGTDYVSVIVEVGDSHQYSHVYRDGRVELLKGSFFSKADFYGTDPRRFLTILQGCYALHTTNPCFFNHLGFKPLYGRKGSFASGLQ